MPIIIRFVVGFIWRVLAVDVIGTAISIIARIILTLLHRGFSIARISAILVAISKIMPKSVQQRAVSLLNSTIDSALGTARLNGNISYAYFGGNMGNLSSGGGASISATFKIGSKTLTTSPFGLNMQQGSGVVLNVLRGAAQQVKNASLNTFSSTSFNAPLIKEIARKAVRRELFDYWKVEARKKAINELESLIGKASLTAILGYVTQLENLNANSTTPIEMSGYSEPFKIKLKIDLKATLHAKSDKFQTDNSHFTSNGSCGGGYCTSPYNQSVAYCTEAKKKKKWERKSGSTGGLSLNDQDATFYVSKISVQHGSGIDSGLRSAINAWAAGLANNRAKLINAINNTTPPASNPKWTDVAGVLSKVNNEFSSWLSFLNAISIVKTFATFNGVGGCFHYRANQNQQYANIISCSSTRPPAQDAYGASCSWTTFSSVSSSTSTEAKTLETKDKTISFPSFYGWAEYNSSVGVAAFTFAKMESTDTLYPNDSNWVPPNLP